MRNIGKPSGLQLKGAKTDAEAGHDSGTGTLGRVQARAPAVGRRDRCLCARARRLSRSANAKATAPPRLAAGACVRSSIARTGCPGRARACPRAPCVPTMVGAMRWATATTIARSGIPTRPAPRSFGGAIRLYDLIVVLDHNRRPRRQGGGSAIFLHVAGEGYPPTAGCIALQRAASAARARPPWSGQRHRRAPRATQKAPGVESPGAQSTYREVACSRQAAGPDGAQSPPQSRV